MRFERFLNEAADHHKALKSAGFVKDRKKNNLGNDVYKNGEHTIEVHAANLEGMSWQHSRNDRYVKGGRGSASLCSYAPHASKQL